MASGRMPGYHRHNLGPGNTVKAVTRTRRAAASRSLGKAPGKEPGPPNWRIHKRRELEKLLVITEAAIEREEAA